MQKGILKLTTIVLFSFSLLTSQAQSLSDVDEFNQAYNNYRTALAKKNSVETLRYAEQAFSISKKAFGLNHENTAGVASNYAISYLTNQLKLPAQERTLDEAIPLFEQAVESYSLAFGENSTKLIKPLMMLGDIHNNYLSNSKKSLKPYNRALSIAEANKDTSPLQHADIALKIGSGLAQQANGVRAAKKYLQIAYDYYHSNLKSSDPRVATSSFWLAKYYYAIKKNGPSIKYFQEVIKLNETAEQLALSEPDINIESISDRDTRKEHLLVAYGFLFNHYQRAGEKEEATRYCQAIGKAQPWDGSREPKPIFLTLPKWPQSVLRSGKGGVVRIGFIIDKEGFVKEPSVLESSGHKKLRKTALKAIDKWRFAPKFEDGEPVEAEVKYSMVFSLGR